MELKNVINFHQGEATVRVFGRIGRHPETGDGIDGTMMAHEIAYLDAEPSVNKIVLSINSEGGSVMDALNIVAAIRNASTPVCTVIEGLAASAASFIAVAASERRIVDFGRVMVHNPSIKGKEARDQADAKIVTALDNFGSMIAEIMSKNSGKSKEDMLALMDAETWMTAQEALDAGLVDEVIETGLTDVLASIDLETADLAAVCNELITKHDTVDIKQINAALGLPEDGAIDVASNKLREVMNELETLRQFKNQAEEREAAAAKQVATEKATALVENAIKEGRATESQKDYLIEQATNNLEGVKTFLEAQPKPANRIDNHIDEEGNGEVIDGKYNGKTLRELEKTEPEVVANLLKNDRAAYDALYAAQYPKQ